MHVAIQTSSSTLFAPALADLTGYRAIATLREVHCILLTRESPMAPSAATDNAGYAAGEPPDAGPSAAESTSEPGSSATDGAADASLPRRDAIDLLLALFDRMGAILPPLALLALGAGVSYLGAICVTTALLRRSAAAQEFFVSLLATMLWSGYMILITIGVGIALFSLIQLTLWPRGWVWRWLARRLGRPVAWAATLLWSVSVLVEAFLVGWGFELWALSPYIELRAALGLAPAPAGLLVVSALVAPVIALLPEWCARVGLTRLVRIWRLPSGIDPS